MKNLLESQVHVLQSDLWIWPDVFFQTSFCSKDMMETHFEDADLSQDLLLGCCRLGFGILHGIFMCHNSVLSPSNYIISNPSEIWQLGWWLSSDDMWHFMHPWCLTKNLPPSETSSSEPGLCQVVDSRPGPMGKMLDALGFFSGLRTPQFPLTI